MATIHPRNLQAHDRKCVVCGVAIRLGYRCGACMHALGNTLQPDFSPNNTMTFYLKEDELARARALKLERLKGIWKARGWG